LTSGRLLIAAGLTVILILSVDVPLRALGCLFWVTIGWFELRRLQLGFDSCNGIRIHSNGEIAILNNDQEWVPGTLQSGSVLLRRLGWLRLQSSNGRIFLELIRGDARQSQDWRRLQVIWRHIGA